MNANELADLLEVDSWYKLVTREEIAAMLRQQADLIRNLQKSLGFKNSGYETINLTPQLELTDEEIEGWITDWAKDLYGTLYVEPTDHQRTMAIKMARAILRKSQEK